MATFKAQVTGLTGITIDTGTSPTQDELTEFLNDGVKDVTQKCILLNPQNAEQFTRISGEVISNGSEKVARADILSVVREADVNDDWRECRRIPTSIQSRVTDTTSLHYASSYNPVYMVAEDGAISVFPTPGATTKAFKVYYINNNPRGDDDNSVTYNTTGLSFFPNNKVYLVVIYAAIKTIDVNLVFPTIPAFPDISDLVLSWSFPTVPTVPTTPTPISPSVEVPTAPTLSDSDITNTILGTPTTLGGSTTLSGSPNLVSEDKISTKTIVDTLTDIPTYTIPTALSTSIASIDTQISNEDPEMAGVLKDKVIQQIAEYEANVKNNLNDFNREKAIYEANLKKILKSAEVTSAEAIKSADIMSKENIKLAELLSLERTKSAEITSKENIITAEIESNETVKSAEIKSMEAVKLAELLSNDDANKLQKYKIEIDSYIAEVQKYGAEIELWTSEMQGFRAEVEGYTSNVGQVVQENQGRVAVHQQNVSLLIEHSRQKVASLIEEFNANAGWLQSRKQDLIQEYNRAFDIMVPAQQQQEPKQKQQARG